MAKVTKSEIDLDEVIVLRSVYEKAINMKYYIQPCRDKFGNYPQCVKFVDAAGNMILTEKEKELISEHKAVFFPENHMFEITSGKTYNLNRLEDKAEWDCIKNCKLIAKSRDERDEKGNLLIDGIQPTANKAGVNGIAELYIDRPGLDTQRRVSKKELIHKAESFIFDDPRGNDGRLKMARILGKNMYNQPDADVKDFLLRIASKELKKIIDLYTGGDTTLRILFIDAKEKHTIYVKNKLYLYGDNIVLGATDDAVIAWMKNPTNLKVLELIKKDTYPDLYSAEK